MGAPRTTKIRSQAHKRPFPYATKPTGAPGVKLALVDSLYIIRAVARGSFSTRTRLLAMSPVYSIHIDDVRHCPNLMPKSGRPRNYIGGRRSCFLPRQYVPFDPPRHLLQHRKLKYFHQTLVQRDPSDKAAGFRVRDDPKP